MSTIPRLPTRTMSAGDLFPFYSSNNSDDAKASITALATLIGEILDISGSSSMVTKYLTSVDGTATFTKSISSTSGNVWYLITITGAEAEDGYSFTLTLPDENYVTDHQEISFTFEGDQSLDITLTGNGATAIPSPITLTYGQYATIRYDVIGNTWHRVG